MFRFIQNLVGVKTDQVVSAGMEALVRWDPASATEAELRSMEQHLDELGQQVAQARQTYEREKQEADQIAALSQQRMAAAEQLQKQSEAETDPTRKAGLERSLATLVGMLEQMNPDVEREKRDANDAHDFLTSLEQAYQEAGGKLTTARSALEHAQRDMSRAAQQRSHAEEQAEAARRTAGLASTTSGLTVALKAMQDSAAKDMASADAAMMKAKLLRPTHPEQDDPNIAAALATAQGKPALSLSLADRLKALKGPQA